MNKALALFTLSLSALSSVELSSAAEASDGPAISPLPESAWSEEQKNLFGYLQSVDAEAKKPLNMLRTIAHHAKLLDVFLPMATQLGAATTMPRRELELLALRTAWRAESPYEWVHHFDYGLDAGLSEEEMLSLLKEVPEGKWSDTDRLLIRTADELVTGTQVTAQTLSQLMAIFNNEEVIEIIFVVNQYNSLSKFANSLGIGLEAGYAQE